MSPALTAWMGGAWMGGAALAVAGAAAWFVVPRPPVLDAEAWFKDLLVRRLRASGLDDATIGHLVPYHPLARWPERKLAHPGVASMPGAPLPGEHELESALAALPDVASRFGRLYADSVAQLAAARAGLSPDHTARRWLGPQVSDDTPLPELSRAAEQRLEATWVVLGPVADTPLVGLGDALAREAVPVTWTGTAVDDALYVALGLFLRDVGRVARATETTWRFVQTWSFLCGAAALHAVVDGIAAAIEATLPDDRPSARLVVVATGRDVPLLLRALAGHVAVRDRVAAVVSIGGAILGRPGDVGPLSEAACADWMDHHFRHERLDLEVVRLVPYVSVQWLDPDGDPASPPGAAGLPVASQRFPTPGYVGAESPAIEPVDLGPLVPDPSLPAEAVVDALRVVVDLVTLSRR
ncbi:MAG: hypothetical protein H6733_02575 [Alphaproteobacteria bacterium]|nr:hypothetical protein [Alphaproteobacteria bacterium]